MIRKLLVGSALGFIGKKLYDNVALDPYIARTKEAFDEALRGKKVPSEASKSSPA